MITPENVRRLLESDSDAVLVLIEGRTEVIGPDALESDDYRGALRVITRAELVAQIGGDALSDRELSEQAAALETAIAELGG